MQDNNENLFLQQESKPVFDNSFNSSKKDNNYLDDIILGKTSPNTNIGVTNENKSTINLQN
jgi:hypothetical protein